MSWEIIIEMRVRMSEKSWGQPTRVTGQESCEGCVVLFLFGSGDKALHDDVDGGFAVGNDSGWTMYKCHLAGTEQRCEFCWVSRCKMQIFRLGNMIFFFEK